MGPQRMQSKWLCCPICGAKTRTKVFDSTVLIDFPLFCRECQKEIVVTLVEKRISYQENNNEPDRESRLIALFCLNRLAGGIPRQHRFADAKKKGGLICIALREENLELITHSIFLTHMSLVADLSEAEILKDEDEQHLWRIARQNLSQGRRQNEEAV